MKSRCEYCGKVCHATKKAAKQAKRRFHASHHSVFKCGEYFHTGRLPVAVIAGTIGRADILPPNSTREAVTARRESDPYWEGRRTI